MTETADAVIVGGGCMGTSIAMHLAKRGMRSVAVLEKNFLASGPTGKSSAVLRQHYPIEILAQTSQRSLDVFAHFSEAIGGEAGFVRTGWLIGVAASDVAALRGNIAMQQGLGINVRELTVTELCALVPRLNPEGIAAAAYHPDSAYVDPSGVTAGFAAAARRLGVRIYQQTRATNIQTAKGRVTAVVAGDREIATPVVVNAAGPWGAEIGRMVGVEFPIRPTRHQIAFFHRPPDFGPPHPIYADPLTNTYFRPEGGELTLCGGGLASALQERVDPDAYNDRTDSEAIAAFAEALVHRFPVMIRSTHHGGYAGVYDTTPDEQPILGPVAEMEGFYCCVGWSGHGFKHSPAIGELMAEWITDCAPSLDLSLFRLSRFEDGALIQGRYLYTWTSLTPSGQTSQINALRM